MRAAWILLLAGCASAPDAALLSLDYEGAKLGYSAGPPPHYGWILSGTADPALVRGIPEELRGSRGTAKFLPGLFTRGWAADGLYRFTAAIGEADLSRCCGFLGFDPDVKITFVDAEGRRIVAAGRLRQQP